MSSAFESDVYAERRRIPWASIDLEYFAKEICQNTEQGEVKLEVSNRPAVSTRLWFLLHWTGADGLEYCVAAQTLDLCLWRAAVREMSIRRRVEGPEVPAGDGKLAASPTEEGEHRPAADATTIA